MAVTFDFLKRETTRSFLAHKCILHLDVGSHLPQVCRADTLPQFFPYAFVRADDAIEATPQQSDRLLDKVQNEWNGFRGEEGIAAKDTRGRDVARGEYRNSERRFYFAVVECLPSTTVINELLTRFMSCKISVVTCATTRIKCSFLSHLDRTPNRISRTKSPPNRPIESTNRCVPAKIHQFIDLRVGRRRRDREKTIQYRITIAIV